MREKKAAIPFPVWTWVHLGKYTHEMKLNAVHLVQIEGC